MRAWTAAPAAPHAVSRRRSARRFPACRTASRPASLASNSTPTCAAACSATQGGPPCARRWRLRPACAATRPGQPCAGWAGSNAARAQSRSRADSLACLRSVVFAGTPVCRSAGLPVCRSAGLPVYAVNRKGARACLKFPEPVARRCLETPGRCRVVREKGMSAGRNLPTTLRRPAPLGGPTALRRLGNDLGAGSSRRVHGGASGLVEHPTDRGWISFQPLRHS